MTFHFFLKTTSARHKAIFSLGSFFTRVLKGGMCQMHISNHFLKKILIEWLYRESIPHGRRVKNFDGQRYSLKFGDWHGGDPGFTLTANPIFTARKRSLGQGNIFTLVCHSVHGGGGVCLSACWDTRTPPSRPPQDQAPPLREQSMLGDTVNERAVRILLECNLVCQIFAKTQ